MGVIRHPFGGGEGDVGFLPGLGAVGDVVHLAVVVHEGVVVFLYNKLLTFSPERIYIKIFSTHDSILLQQFNCLLRRVPRRRRPSLRLLASKGSDYLNRF